MDKYTGSDVRACALVRFLRDRQSGLFQPCAAIQGCDDQFARQLHLIDPFLGIRREFYRGYTAVCFGDLEASFQLLRPQQVRLPVDDDILVFRFFFAYQPFHFGVCPPVFFFLRPF